MVKDKMSDKRQKIILKAAAEFAKNGYDRASVDNICLAAGVAKGTFYYHFKSKEEILEAILTEGEKKFEEILAKKVEKIKSAVDKFKAMVAAEREFIAEYRDYFRVFIGEILEKKKRFLSMESVIKEGVVSGAFRKDLEVKKTVSAVFWLIAMTSLNGEEQGQEELLLNGIMNNVAIVDPKENKNN